jgi:type IV pilus assembly protein PilX
MPDASPRVSLIHTLGRAGSAVDRGRQRGVALLVALILLAVIILVGLGAIGTTILQNKATANQYDRQVAFQAAEAALRQAQIAITSATASQAAPAGFEDCSANATPLNNCLADPFADANVTAAQIASVPKSAFSSALAASAPQYVVQYMGQFKAPPQGVRQIGGGPAGYGTTPPGAMSDYYRITARSGNPSDVKGRAVVTLQSVFRN